MITYIPQPKRPKTLLTVLSQDEVAALLRASRHLKSRAILMALYAAGLRVSELCHLQVEITTVSAWWCVSFRAKGSRTALSCSRPVSSSSFAKN